MTIMAKKRNKIPGGRGPTARPVEPGQFTHDYRLQTISLKEIVLPMKRAVLEIETYRDRDGVERVLTVGNLLNALALAFVELPAARRASVAAKALARLEAFRAALGPPGMDRDDGNSNGNGNGIGDVAELPPAAGPRRRKTS